MQRWHFVVWCWSCLMFQTQNYSIPTVAKYRHHRHHDGDGGDDRWIVAWIALRTMIPIAPLELKRRCSCSMLPFEPLTNYRFVRQPICYANFALLAERPTDYRFAKLAQWH
jgi:hypothetical protein